MPKDRKDPRRILRKDDGQPAVDMALGLRRRFELDPAGAVQPQVEFKLTELAHRGLWQDLAEEGVLRRLLTHYYQTEAGIAEPRHLTNQERADLSIAFRDAGTAGRIGLLETLEADHGPDFPAVTKELFKALPMAERPGAHRIAAQFLENREAGIDPLVGAQIAGLPQDLKAISEQEAAEQARATAASGNGEGPGDVETQEPEEPLANVAKLESDASAAATLESGIGITGDWAGPAFPQDDSAFLAALVDEALTAERDELPDLIDRINAAFGDDSATAQRLIELARMRFAEPEGFQGQFGLGRRQEAERELRLRRDRLLAGQDYHTQRHFDRAAFARAEAVSGLRLQLQENGSIAIGKPGEAALVTVGWSVASAMVRNPDKLRERLALLERLTTSTEPLDEQIEQINRALGFSDQVDIETPTTDEEDTRAAILAANAMIGDGRDPAAVRAGVIGVLFPEIHEDPIAWGDLLLDVLPVIGEGRALADALESLDAFFEAIERGDAEDANRQALLTVMNAAGVLPLAGPLFKALGTVATKGLRTRIGSSLARKADPFGFLSRRRLAKSRDRREDLSNQGNPADAKSGSRPKRSPEFASNPRFEHVFAEVLPSLSANQQRLLKGLWPHLLGKPTELDFRQLLRNAGFELIEGPNVSALKAGGKKAIFDDVSHQGFPKGFETLTNTLFFPKLGAEGTLFEFKLGNAPLSKAQELGEAAVDAARRNKTNVTTEGGIDVVAVEILRHDFSEIPEALLEKEARRLLGNHANGVRSKRLTQGDVDEIVGAFLAFHRKLRNQTAGEMPTIGEAFAALGMAASVRAAENAAGLESEGGRP